MPSTPRLLAEAGVRVDAVVRLPDQSIEASEAHDILFTEDWLNYPATPVAVPISESHIIFGTSGSTGIPSSSASAWIA